MQVVRCFCLGLHRERDEERERERKIVMPLKRSQERVMWSRLGEEIDKKRVEMRMKKKAEEENNDRKG